MGASETVRPSETEPQLWPLCLTQALGFPSLLLLAEERKGQQKAGLSGHRSRNHQSLAARYCRVSRWPVPVLPWNPRPSVLRGPGRAQSPRVSFYRQSNWDPEGRSEQPQASPPRWGPSPPTDLGSLFCPVLWPALGKTVFHSVPPSLLCPSTPLHRSVPSHQPLHFHFQASRLALAFPGLSSRQPFPISASTGPRTSLVVLVLPERSKGKQPGLGIAASNKSSEEKYLGFQSQQWADVRDAQT